MFPYVSTAPQYNRQAPKIPALVSTRPASGAADPQPIMPNRYPEPASHLRKSSANSASQILRTCVTVQQIKRRPGHANHTYLRSGGVASTSCAYVFTGMRTPSRPWTRASVTWSHLHGHGNIPSPGTPSTRPARTALTDQAPTQLTQTPTSNDWGAWASGYGIASRCDDGVGVRGPRTCQPA